MNKFYAVSNNNLTFFNKLSGFVTHEIILYLCQKTSESHQRQVSCHPESSLISQKKKVKFSFKICCDTLVCNFSAHLLLWVRNSNSQLFFEMQPVTKRK